MKTHRSLSPWHGGKDRTTPHFLRFCSLDFFVCWSLRIVDRVLTAGNPLTLKVPRVRGKTLPSGLLHSNCICDAHFGLNFLLELFGRVSHITSPVFFTRTTLNSNLVPRWGNMYRILSRRFCSPILLFCIRVEGRLKGSIRRVREVSRLSWSVRPRGLLP